MLTHILLRPSQSQEGALDDASKVTRRTRVSFKRHQSVLMEDLMDELEQEFGDLSIDSIDDNDIIESCLVDPSPGSRSRVLREVAYLVL